jgi:hypothetical protein
MAWSRRVKLKRKTEAAMQVDLPLVVIAAEGEDTPRGRLRRVENASGAFLQADRRLVDRCLAGEVAAWEAFYAQCHDPLCTAIRIMLGRPHGDPNLVDEIAARVWYALVANDGKLLGRYSPEVGARLITFMRALARDEICRHFRAEIRRRQREFLALRERPQSGGIDPGQSAIGLTEFLSTLTPQEHSFCCEVLLAEPAPNGEISRSAANIWQLTHRIYKKLLHFLARGK